MKAEETRNKDLSLELESLKMQLLKAEGDNASKAITNESSQVHLLPARWFAPVLLLVGLRCMLPGLCP